MTFKQKIKAILNEGLVLPILKLRETHPDHDFTEKGFNTLLDNTTKDMLTFIRKYGEDLK